MIVLSFRARVFLLVVVVALSTAAATAWLTVRQATEQVQQSAVLARQDVERITNDITAYGLLHASWQDVGGLIQELARVSGQRVRVVDVNGVSVADSAPSGDWTSAQAVAVQTRPVVKLNRAPLDRRFEAARAMLLYEVEVGYARCLQQYGVRAEVKVQSDGSYGFEAASGDPSAAFCMRAEPDAGGPEFPLLAKRFEAACGVESEMQCIQREIAEFLAESTAPPVQVFIGSAGQAKLAEIELAPALIAAGLVSFIVLVASLLISRQVLRPIASLAAAARKLGEGDLSERVPERGRDQLAQLTHSFNSMADSLESSRQQQHHMIADIAHELRTPLANIRNYVEALDDGVYQPGPETYQSMREEVLLQQRLVDDLQELALAESGSLVYHFDRVDLVEVVQACRTAHSSAATAGEVTIEVEAHGAVFAMVDQARLRQVVANLITNGLRATPQGGVITLRVRGEHGKAVVEVADTGNGIAPEHVQHVFDRFWRADTARSRDTGGRGLGLAIARELITAQGGEIEVKETSPLGTVFVIRLPLA
jgi:two-component system, OmpR family, sensor histidine kinase BaeS